MIKPVLKYLDIVEIKDESKGFLARGAAYIGEEGIEGVGRAQFIVHTFDAYVIDEQIDEILADSIRPTWEEVAKAINRHLEWEYDNIKYETIEQALERINRID